APKPVALRKDLIPNRPQPSIQLSKNPIITLKQDKKLSALTIADEATGEQSAGDATGVGTAGDDGETSKEPDDHLGDSGSYLKLCPISNVLGTVSPSSSQARRATSSSSSFESGPSSSDPSLLESDSKLSPLVFSIISDVPGYLFRTRGVDDDASDDDDGVSYCTSYEMMKVIGLSLLSLWLREQVTWQAEDNGMVESNGVVECDEVILVSNDSEALNSSSVRGETSVGSGEVGVWSDDGGVVLVVYEPVQLSSKGRLMMEWVMQ
nr:hypothetical protein [Tanacetum cinerariifolium]